MQELTQAEHEEPTHEISIQVDSPCDQPSEYSFYFHDNNNNSNNDINHLLTNKQRLLNKLVDVLHRLLEVLSTNLLAVEGDHLGIGLANGLQRDIQWLQRLVSLLAVDDFDTTENVWL